MQLRQNEANILLKKKSPCEHMFRSRIVTVQNLEDVCQVLQSFLAAIKTGKFLSTISCDSEQCPGFVRVLSDQSSMAITSAVLLRLEVLRPMLLEIV